jgi:hypothetical protein
VAVSYQSWRSNALTEAFWRIKRNVTRYNRGRFLSWRADKFHRFVTLSRGMAALHLLVAAERARVYEEMLGGDLSIAGGKYVGGADNVSDGGSERDYPGSPESEVSSLVEDVQPVDTDDESVPVTGNRSAGELMDSSQPPRFSGYPSPDMPDLSPPPAPRPALNIAAVMLPAVELDRPLRSTAMSPDNLVLSPGSPSIDGSAHDDVPDLNQTALHALRDSDSELSMFLSSDSELSLESAPEPDVFSAPAMSPPLTSLPAGTPVGRERHVDADSPSCASAGSSVQECRSGASTVAHPPYAFPFAEVLRESDAYRRRTLLLQGLYKLEQWMLRAQSADTMVEVLLQYRKTRRLRVALNTLRAKALL